MKKILPLFVLAIEVSATFASQWSWKAHMSGTLRMFCKRYYKQERVNLETIGPLYSISCRSLQSHDPFATQGMEIAELKLEFSPLAISFKTAEMNSPR